MKPQKVIANKLTEKLKIRNEKTGLIDENALNLIENILKLNPNER